MAYEIPGQTLTLKANATFAAKQYRFVKPHSTAGQAAVCSSSLDAPLGILQDTPVTLDAASVMISGVSKVTLGAAATVGDFIGTDANGLAVPLVIGTDTTKYVKGRLLEAGTTNEIVTCVLFSGANRAS